MANHPRHRTRKPIVAWFTLPSGPKALAVWTRGDAEGELYADATWQADTGEEARLRAESLADEAIGADEVTWLWYAITELEKNQHTFEVPRAGGP